MSLSIGFTYPKRTTAIVSRAFKVKSLTAFNTTLKEKPRVADAIDRRM